MLITVSVNRVMAVPVFCRGHAGMAFKGIGKRRTVTVAQAERDGKNTPVCVAEFYFCTFHCLMNEIFLECDTHFFVKKG